MVDPDLILTYAGMAFVLVGAIMFVVAAFRESMLWGFGCLLFAPIQLIFLICHFSKAWLPTLIQFIGFCMLVVGLNIVGF